jgi:hypothetical protein
MENGRPLHLGGCGGERTSTESRLFIQVAANDSFRVATIRKLMAIRAFGRSRPAADASREVEERWLLYGL